MKDPKCSAAWQWARDNRENQLTEPLSKEKERRCDSSNGKGRSGAGDKRPPITTQCQISLKKGNRSRPDADDTISRGNEGDHTYAKAEP